MGTPPVFLEANMSWVFDKTQTVWSEHIRPHVPDQMLAEFFERVLGAMHNANHRVPSSDGKFEGDGLNHDPDLNKAVQRLEKYVNEQMKGTTEGSSNNH
jgi:hypothetical protein